MSLETENFHADEKNESLFALIVSGDGLFPTFSRKLAHAFNRRGVDCAIVPSARYFWRRRSPEEFAMHLEARLEHHLRRHRGDRFILIGYSFGGAALPFAIRRLPAELRAQIAYVVLAAPATRADFEFKIISWFNIAGKDALDTEAELDRMLEEATPTLFLYGRRDFRRARASIDGGEEIIFDGGHNLGGDYEEIASVILKRSSKT